MIWDPLSIWQLLGLFAFGLLVTLLANWLVGGRAPGKSPLGQVVSSAVWVLLLFAAGVIAARYIERVEETGLGYLTFAAGAFALSLLRVWLARRAQGREWNPALHNLTYLLAAAAVLFLSAWLLGRPVEVWLLLPLWIGVALPALDAWPPWGRRLAKQWGGLPVWRTPLAAGVVALVAAPLLLVDATAWAMLPLGFLVCLAVDTLHPPGVMWLWPWRETRYRLREEPLPWSWATGGLALAVAGLLLVVEIGPPPPPPAPAPTFEQALDQYYALRGRNLVFAYLDGSWQVSGRRSSGRFEVVGAEGQSLIMLDRYTGRVFRAGRGASDDFYPNYISLQTGDAARIKPVEVHLENQPLAEALPVLYQMQREPGLQYIFVSGQVVGGDLPVEHPQTRLPKIQAEGEGHYRLSYLTAADLIALADRTVEIADLVIWATYVETPVGPTVTPLPTLGVGSW